MSAPEQRAAGGQRPVASTPTGGLAQVDGAELYYEIAGVGQPLVLIHGGNLDRRMWDDQVSAFGEHYRTIRYDVRGAGRSSFPDTPFAHRDDLYGLLRRLSVGQAHLVGLSLGGIIALDFALDHPDLVTALVLVSSGLSGHQYSERVMLRLAPILEALRANDLPRARGLWLDDPCFGIPPECPVARERMPEMLDDCSFAHWSRAKGGLERRLDPPAIERLSDVQAPTLVVVGERDDPDILAIADRLETGIPGAAKAVLVGAHHMLNMEQPQTFNGLLLGFLSRDTPGSTGA